MLGVTIDHNILGKVHVHGDTKVSQQFKNLLCFTVCIVMSWLVDTSLYYAKL